MAWIDNDACAWWTCAPVILPSAKILEKSLKKASNKPLEVVYIPKTNQLTLLIWKWKKTGTLKFNLQFNSVIRDCRDELTLEWKTIENKACTFKLVSKSLSSISTLFLINSSSAGGIAAQEKYESVTVKFGEKIKQSTYRRQLHNFTPKIYYGLITLNINSQTRTDISSTGST